MTRLRFSLGVCALLAGSLASVAHAEGRGVRTPDAVKIFNDVCAKTYPSFKEAKERALALGHTFEQENPSKDLWISAFSNSASGRTGCSIRYGTVETVVKLLKNLELLGAVNPTGPYTATVQFRDTPHKIEVRIDETRTNGRIMVSLRFDMD
jgi:hypothetical protein